MEAIKNKLAGEGILTVDFNAWRFEREPQLLVPMLDTIRGALAERAALAEVSGASGGEDPDTARKLRVIAGRIGRVVKALAMGLSGSVGSRARLRLTTTRVPLLTHLRPRAPSPLQARRI